MIIKILFSFVLLSSALTCYARQIDIEKLSQEAASYYKSNQFDAFLAELSSLNSVVDEKEQANIEYLRALTYLEKLVYLESQEDWESYYNLKDGYLKKIVTAASKLAGDYPRDLLGLKSGYLRWRAYEYNESEDDARNAFEMFQSALMEYVKVSKDREKIREYAAIFKKSGKSRLSARLHNLYIEQSLANQDYTPIFEIAAEYARENDFEQTRIVLRDALKHNPPDETACAMLKFIAESYLPDRQPDKYGAVFKEIVENYPFNKYTEEAFNKAKNAFREYDYGLKAEVTEKGKESGYIAYLQGVADKFKGTKLAADSLCFLGDYYSSNGEKQKAAALFEEIIAEYPECRWAESLLEKLRDGENI
ncbi:MAG: hypothetical protein KJ915_03800 [Candidatus Omnitrophica bacterium]|nr:hypothetical protein [Candidatus Omnitrophota bacterium]